jgi:hypothetical protein
LTAISEARAAVAECCCKATMAAFIYCRHYQRRADGSVTGLRARGGVTVDISWTGGKISKAVLRPSVAGAQRIRVPAGHG